MIAHTTGQSGRTDAEIDVSVELQDKGWRPKLGTYPRIPSTSVNPSETMATP